MNDEAPYSTDEHAALDRSAKTPFYEALQSDRYHRQGLIRTIQERSNTDVALMSYVAGADTEIYPDDVIGFVELLHQIDLGRDIDLMLHSTGGDINVAGKLITMVRDRVQNGILRVIVPHYAKSAATLMALGSDTIVMSDSSELGPIDPQVRFPDGQGKWVRYSAFSYMKAYTQFTSDLKKNLDDPIADLMLDKFQPHQMVEIERVLDGTRHLAEKLLQNGMMAGRPSTEPVSRLMDKESWHTHGQVISADDAQSIGLTVTYMPSDDPVWASYWKLYCLQRLGVPEGQKLFESDFVSLAI